MNHDERDMTIFIFHLCVVVLCLFAYFDCLSISVWSFCIYIYYILFYVSFCVPS